MLAALAFVPVAKGASIDLSTKQFSPKVGPLFVNAVVGREARIRERRQLTGGAAGAEEPEQEESVEAEGVEEGEEAKA